MMSLLHDDSQQDILESLTVRRLSGQILHDLADPRLDPSIREIVDPEVLGHHVVLLIWRGLVPEVEQELEEDVVLCKNLASKRQVGELYMSSVSSWVTSCDAHLVLEQPLVGQEPRVEERLDLLLVFALALLSDPLHRSIALGLFRLGE